MLPIENTTVRTWTMDYSVRRLHRGPCFVASARGSSVFASSFSASCKPIGRPRRGLFLRQTYLVPCLNWPTQARVRLLVLFALGVCCVDGGHHVGTGHRTATVSA
ncbi:hypothetical protein CC80DRAFT_591970 [Byssothecium circinans]|uniref:Uncharacterized protein n=1 Tax=Byssothecium circinans TaxID=147558 RepID=A0A6A5U038_9PLEO|nr:hypothetical protein CC80DRAFT_591970 [Byssothecium circinans]